MSSKLIPNLSVTDGFDFVKKIWGSLPIPNVINPTTDLDELDKRIADLKAVEQWLNVNLSMLRATIQGLEVQRGTIATIKSFGSNLAGTPDRTPSGLDEQTIRRMMAQMAEPARVEEPPQVPNQKLPEPKVPEAVTESISSMATQAQEQSKAIASAWWGLLQDQLNKVAAAAMSGAGLSGQAGESNGDAAPPKKSTRTKAGESKSTKASASKARSGSRGSRSSS